MELKEDLMEIVQSKRKRRVEVVRMKQERVGVAYTDTAPWDKPEKVIEVFSPFLGDSAVECFFAAALNCKAEPMAIQLMGVGGVDSCPASVADILKFALASNASSLILVHNHPSGYPAPSREDRTLTGRIEEACKLIGLKLNDHIIIGGDGYGYSIRGEDYVDIMSASEKGMFTCPASGELDRDVFCHDVRNMEDYTRKGGNTLCTREYPQLA